MEDGEPMSPSSYVFIKCDLACESSKFMKGQIIAYFIIEEGDDRYKSIVLRIIAAKVFCIRHHLLNCASSGC